MRSGYYGCSDKARLDGCGEKVMNVQAIVETLVSAIEPYDELEQRHKLATLAWIAESAPLCRITKPDIPPQHLVAYFVLLDQAQGKLLLVDHRNAGLWLPSGGHIETALAL
jgi:hypothetical protein